MRRFALPLAALLTAAATTAEAHTGVSAVSGFGHGLVHPLGGVDHVLVMVAVGLVAVHLGGRALWAVPLSFLAMIAVGGVFGMTGVGLPGIELGIGLSVVLLGLAVALRVKISTAAAMAAVGAFAIFHGYAHGAEMPASASGLDYAAGFVLATALLHLAGIGLGAAIARIGEVFGSRVLRTAGSAMALAGVAILGGLL